MPCPGGGHSGCQPVRLGGNLRGLIHEGFLEKRPSTVPHKISGAFSCVSHPKAVSSVPQGTSCLGEDGQYNSSFLHQQTGMVMFPSATHVGTQTDFMDLNLGADLLSR